MPAAELLARAARLGVLTAFGSGGMKDSGADGRSGVHAALIPRYNYLAESRIGFTAERLFRLMDALGSDTRLYLDEPIKPGVVR